MNSVKFVLLGYKNRFVKVGEVYEGFSVLENGN